ncbi:MAG: hypothetical protein M0037_05705 [Betaproteobacteria bacterium]|nr:hypothetical protein [Betaproteobacteria bacterium]
MKRERLGTLLILGTLTMGSQHAWAGSGHPAHASGQARSHPDLIFPVQESTQLNLGDLQIGVGYVGYGAYIAEKGNRRYGLHASLSIVIDDKPSLFQQPDVHKGQVVSVGGYRITIVDISTEGRGSVALEVNKENEQGSHMGARAQ